MCSLVITSGALNLAQRNVGCEGCHEELSLSEQRCTVHVCVYHTLSFVCFCYRRRQQSQQALLSSVAGNSAAICVSAACSCCVLASICIVQHLVSITIGVIYLKTVVIIRVDGKQSFKKLICFQCMCSVFIFFFFNISYSFRNISRDTTAHSKLELITFGFEHRNNLHGNHCDAINRGFDFR